MGNNTIFNEMEFYVVTLYDKGVLDKELLSIIMERYRGDTDIGEGGYEGTLAKDGKDVHEIILYTFGIKLCNRPPVSYDCGKTLTDEEIDENETYYDWQYTEFSKITDKFGWR
jgi:hypothetical protein